MKIKIKKSWLIPFVMSLIVLLSYKFPFSSYIEIGCVCAFAVYLILIRLKKMGRLSLQNTYVISFVLFVIWGTLSFLWASSAQGIREQLFHMYIAIFINVAMMIYISSKQQNFDEIIKWLLPVMFILEVEALLIGTWDNNMRFRAISAVNQFGICASIMYLFALFYLKKQKKKSAIGLIVTVLAAGLALFTGSRKALMNLVIFTCFIFIFEKYDKNVLKNLGKVLVVVAIAVIGIFIVLRVDVLYQTIGHRVESLFLYFNGDIEKDLSALRRAYMKQDAIEFFLAHPLKGIGLNNFKYVARYGTYAHSNYYEMLCNLGLVGFLLYYIPIVIVAVMSFSQWKKNIPNSALSFAIFISFFIDEFSNISYMYGIIHIFLGIAAGMIFGNEKQLRLRSNMNLENIAKPKGYYHEQRYWKRNLI